MEDSNEPPSAAHLTDSLKRGDIEEFSTSLNQFESAAPEDRKDALQALRSLASEQPDTLSPVLSALVPFLIDSERSIRLATAKLFVTVAESYPDEVADVVPSLAERLADEDEFYYVRARAAEALGYVALDDPETVATPETLAELRVGLSFDEPEVKEKLAKALEYVALGQPERLKHHVLKLATHLGDDSELVRYHLCTAVTVVGCEYPEALVDCRDELVARLGDDNAYVRGRAAEALGLLALSEGIDSPSIEESLTALEDDEEPFVTDRAQFAIKSLTEQSDSADSLEKIGTIPMIQDETDTILQEITTPDTEGVCSHCGLALPEHGPPLCPHCGAPR